MHLARLLDKTLCSQDAGNIEKTSHLKKKTTEIMGHIKKKEIHCSSPTKSCGINGCYWHIVLWLEL